jgi:pilus assembly protein CpaF
VPIDPPAVQAIRHLLDDPEISEIMINGLGHLFVERGGLMHELPPIFVSRQQIEVLVENLVGLTGRSVNAKSPFVDFRMADGSRVNIVVPPVALDGPLVTIRKATRSLRTLNDLVDRGALSDRMAFILFTAVRARLNIVFSGGTGSGKTTTLGMLSAYIPEGERIVVIEDTAELDLQQPHVVRLECRPPNMEGTGAIVLGDLLKNSLRMRPTRIILGEIRGDEAFEMLNAMSSGHDGSLAVLHASSPAHAIARLEMMILGRGLPLPIWAIQRQIAGALQLVVQHGMFPDGTRRVTHISEVVGYDKEQVLLRDLFTYEIEGQDPDGRILGRFVCTGERPAFFDKLRRVGGESVDKALAPSARRPDAA